MFPVLIPPNVKRDNDKPVILSDGRMLPAQVFFEALGGLEGLRLTAEPGSSSPRLTRSFSIVHGEILCLSFASARDVDGRVTYGSILFTREMLDAGQLWRLLPTRDLERIMPGAGRALAWLRPQFEVRMPPEPQAPRRPVRFSVLAIVLLFALFLLFLWMILMFVGIG